MGSQRCNGRATAESRTLSASCSTPTKSILDPWQAWVDSKLLAAFGIGIWLSAQGSRSLRVVGALMLLPVATTPLWMIFGEASLAAHIALLLVGILPGSGR